MWDLSGFDLTEEHERTLRATTIDEHGPGTILHDFEALLAFVCGRELPVSEVNELPPLKVLPEMNALMREPIEVRLKRPILKSYPHLEGLYLLLRATGLGQVEGVASNKVLRVDPALHEAWSALNPTERYCTLLETWLLRGNPEIVGEKGARFGLALQQFAAIVGLLRSAGPEGLPIAENSQADWYWYDHPGRMGIALLELFGLAEVDTRPPERGEGWVVDRIYRTPLGAAVFSLVYEAVFGDIDRIDLVDTPPPSSGLLQPAFSTYLPQWQHTLALPSWDLRPGRYTFKVSLARDLWRRIAIDAGEPLDVLASAILNAYDFDHDHLYRFSYRNRYGVEESVQDPTFEDGPWASEVRVGEVPLRVGQSMTFLYDFGDQWEFQVTLEAIEPAGAAGPSVLETRGDAPEQYPDWDAW